MTPLRRACRAALACACTIAALAGCSSSRPIIICSPQGHAFALAVTTAGRVRWQAPVAAPATFGFSLQLPPLTVGAVAVFAEGDALYGLRLADGHRLWSRATRPDMASLWRWQNLVVVLTWPDSDGPPLQPGWGGLPVPVLTGLDAATGQARWTVRIGQSMGGFYPTADGGLVMGRGFGALEVVDMASGHIRWKRSTQSPPGQLRWADTLMPAPLEPGDVEPRWMPTPPDWCPSHPGPAAPGRTTSTQLSAGSAGRPPPRITP